MDEQKITEIVSKQCDMDLRKIGTITEAKCQRCKKRRYSNSIGLRLNEWMQQHAFAYHKIGFGV